MDNRKNIFEVILFIIAATARGLPKARMLKAEGLDNYVPEAFRRLVPAITAPGNGKVQLPVCVSDADASHGPDVLNTCDVVIV